MGCCEQNANRGRVRVALSPIVIVLVLVVVLAPGARSNCQSAEKHGLKGPNGLLDGMQTEDEDDYEFYGK